MALIGISPAPADLTLQFSLSGAVATPPNDSPGIGSGVVTINETTRRIQLDGAYSGLLSDAFAAHIHGLTDNGMVILLGLQISGGRDGTLRLRDTLTTAEVAALASGTTYVNVHTHLFEEGEIAGFITPIPEPATGGLLVVGVLALGLSRSRGAAARILEWQAPAPSAPR